MTGDVNDGGRLVPIREARTAKPSTATATPAGWKFCSAADSQGQK
jgi:hypothetical protein